MLRLSCRLVLSVAAVVLAGTRSAPAQPPTQLDRIEQKLDTILHQLKQPQSGVPVAAQPPAPTANPNQATASPAPDQAARSPAPDVLAAGALAIIRAAPVTPLAAREIPTDAVGGLIYTGGPLQLADLKEQGVHYNGLPGSSGRGGCGPAKPDATSLTSTAAPSARTPSMPPPAPLPAGWKIGRSAFSKPSPTRTPPSPHPSR
jgi:hypothetical protein